MTGIFRAHPQMKTCAALPPAWRRLREGPMPRRRGSFRRGPARGWQGCAIQYFCEPGNFDFVSIPGAAGKPANGAVPGRG